MSMFCIGQSVCIEPSYLQHNLVAANLSIGEYEELLMWHGVVEQVLDGGMYFVMFMARTNNVGPNVGYTINEAGLRVVWQVGQLVRANARFYNAARLQMLQSVDVRVLDLYPSGNFDATGIVQRDVGSGRYSVMMRLPSNNDNFQAHQLHIDSYELHPVWNIGDCVHLISYGTANNRQQIRMQFPNTHIEDIRAWVCRIDSADNNNNHRYLVSTLPPGLANRTRFEVSAVILRSSGPARMLEMDPTGATSSSHSDDFI